MHNYFSPKTVDGNAFSGFVTPVPEPEPNKPTPPPPAPRLLFDTALLTLASVVIEPEERDELITILRDCGQRANDLLARAHEARLQTLRDEHARVTRECRAQRKKIDSLVVGIGARDNAVRSAGQKTSACRVRLQTCQRDPSVAPENYPSQQELQEHGVKLAKLKRELQDAENIERAENAAQQGLATELREAQQEMGKLSEREATLRSALAGQPYRDKSLGLWTPPEYVK